MAKILNIVIVLIICLFPAATLAAGTEVTSNNLIDKAREYDGRQVVYTGEVIGDILVQGDHTWLNVSDGRNAIGVWVEAKDMQGVDTPGRYNMRGDTVRVTGVFHRACADHGGDFDIHANKMDVTQKGYAVTHQTETVKAVFAFILLAGAAVCLVLVLKTKSRNGGNNGPF